MHVSVEATEGLGRKLTIQVPASKIDEEVNSRLASLAKKVKIDGFRPGKVPVRVVHQRYSDSVMQEVAQDLVQSSLYEAMRENDLTPAGAPFVEPGDIKVGQDFEFTATFEVFPEIKIQDLDGDELKRVVAAVSEGDVTDMLDKLSEQHKVWAQTDGVSKSGSKVDIDFDGFVDGVAFEGGKAEHYELVLGEGSMIPGFEEGVEGLKSGDEKDISVTFPGDYNQADLAGKDAIFKIKLHKVFEGSLPEVNDELAEKFGVKEGGVEKFKSDIRNNMERELERQTTQVNKEKAFDLFLEKNPVDLPKALVDKEVEHLRKDMLQRVFGNQPVDASKLPQLPASMFDIQAKRRVHLGLVFSEFVKVHELKPTPEKVDVFLEKMASSYEKPEEVIDWYRGNQERMGEIEAAVLEEIAVEKMTENLKITEEKMDYNSVMNPPKPETQDNENKAEN